MRRLHIGGKSRVPGWEVLNVIEGDFVDHLGNANDLSQFREGAFAQIYASHVVEHLDYGGELQSALDEWHRVLSPGGRLYVSVPDMDILSRLFVDRERLDINDRYAVMRMMFGGHVDQSDYHQVGLNTEFLAHFLTTAGFVDLRRVESFGLFDDSSSFRFKGELISLNLVAVKSSA
jgi:predicted SAM-dependent methyltransferase